MQSVKNPNSRGNSIETYSGTRGNPNPKQNNKNKCEADLMDLFPDLKTPQNLTQNTPNNVELD